MACLRVAIEMQKIEDETYQPGRVPAFNVAWIMLSEARAPVLPSWKVVPLQCRRVGNRRALIIVTRAACLRAPDRA
jgi:hypothetical protein